MSRDLPIRAIAYMMQERVHGRLPQYVKRKLRTLAKQLETGGGGRFKPGIMLKPGAKPVREWGGRPHNIVVLDDGFDYEGRRYPSLSAIAREIMERPPNSGPGLLRDLGHSEPLKRRTE